MSYIKKTFINCNVLFYDDGYHIKKYNMSIMNGNIKFLGNTISDKVIDCTGKVIIPSLFNTHCHLGESIFKDITGNDWTLEKYLKYTTDYNDKLSVREREKQWLQSATYTVEQCINNAIANICSARSAAISEKNCIRNLAGYPIMKGNKLKTFFEDGLTGFKQYYLENKSETCSVGVCLHSIYLNDKDGLLFARECIKAGADFITVHLSEDEYSRNMEVKTFGKRSAYVLKDYGLLMSKSLLIHCGEISNDEIELIKETDAAIAVCPISNDFLNSKMINVRKLSDLGVNWYIATDGAGTGRTFSMFKQAQRIKKEYPQLSFEELFKRMTLYPAERFKVGGYKGVIAENVSADFAVIDIEFSNMDEFWSNLFNNNWKLDSLYVAGNKIYGG
jgi:5-methylthioadenosine/S-adenosylhomocysteine deaminase